MAGGPQGAGAYTYPELGGAAPWPPPGSFLFRRASGQRWLILGTGASLCSSSLLCFCCSRGALLPIKSSLLLGLPVVFLAAADDRLVHVVALLEALRLRSVLRRGLLVHSNHIVHILVLTLRALHAATGQCGANRAAGLLVHHTSATTW